MHGSARYHITRMPNDDLQHVYYCGMRTSILNRVNREVIFRDSAEVVETLLVISHTYAFIHYIEVKCLNN